MALIAVNTRMLIADKLDGTGWFACETLKRITQGHPEHRFLFFSTESFLMNLFFHPTLFLLPFLRRQGIRGCGICGLNNRCIMH